MRKLILCLILIQFSAHADLDKDEKQGLEDTKAMLKNSSARDKAIKGNAKAMETDAKVSALAGNGANKEEIYDLASQIMEKITVEANGDPNKMQAMMLEAQKNPQGFYDKYFTAEQKAKVQGVSGKIERSKSSIGPKN